MKFQQCLRREDVAAKLLNSRPLFVIPIFTRGRSGDASVGGRESRGRIIKRKGRKWVEAFRKRSRNVCKYDGGRITYVKAWKAERPISIKFPDPFRINLDMHEIFKNKMITP